MQIYLFRRRRNTRKGKIKNDEKHWQKPCFASYRQRSLEIMMMLLQLLLMMIWRWWWKGRPSSTSRDWYNFPTQQFQDCVNCRDPIYSISSSSNSPTSSSKERWWWLRSPYEVGTVATEDWLSKESLEKPWTRREKKSLLFRKTLNEISFPNLLWLWVWTSVS